MKLTPAIKGQLTKGIKKADSVVVGDRYLRFREVENVFLNHMPREQAKHAARKYLATV